MLVGLVTMPSPAMHGHLSSREGILRIAMTLLLCFVQASKTQEYPTDDYRAFVNAVVNSYDLNMSFTGNLYFLLGIICPQSVYCTINDTSEVNSSLILDIANDTIEFSNGFYTENRTKLISEARMYLKDNVNKLTGCCTRCSCEDDCTERQICCPIKSKELRKSIVVQERRIRQQCMYANIKSYSPSLNFQKMETIGLSYYTVTDCFSETFSEDIASKCRHPNQDQAEQIVPVYSSKTERIYKNRFCAECNDDSQVTPWTMVITFNNIFSLIGENDLPPTPEEMYSLLSKTKFTEVFYEPPENMLSTEKNFVCIPSKIIEKECDEAPGLDTDQTYFFKRACQMYQSKYHTYRTTYNNVFCFLCKGKFSGKLSCTGGSRNTGAAFSALLRQDLIDPAKMKTGFTDKLGPCSCTEYYDKQKKKCRKLICPPGESFYGCGCVEFLQNLTGLPVELKLEITPELPDSLVEQTFGGNIEQTVVNSVLTTVMRKLVLRWRLVPVEGPLLFRETSTLNGHFVKFYFIVVIRFKAMTDNRKLVESMFNALLIGLRAHILKIPVTITLGRNIDLPLEGLSTNTIRSAFFQGLSRIVDPLASIESIKQYLTGFRYFNRQTLNKLVFCTRVRLEDDEADMLKNNSVSLGLSQSYVGYMFWEKDRSMCLEDFKTAFMLKASSAVPSFSLCMLFYWPIIIIAF